MKTFIYVAVSLTAALLFSSENVLAEKPNPMDCPCFQDSINAVALADLCLRTLSLKKDGFKKGNYIKSLIYVENVHNQQCAVIRLRNLVSDQDIRVTVGTALNNICPNQSETCFMGGLTPIQVKACGTLQNSLRRELNKIDCP